MRHATASQLVGHRRAPVNEAPREGTKLREAYDLFVANKGKPVSFKRRTNRLIDDLIDYYGLDIRCIRNGQWVLAGEWFGRSYQDYIAEHLEAA